MKKSAYELCKETDSIQSEQTIRDLREVPQYEYTREHLPKMVIFSKISDKSQTRNVMGGEIKKENIARMY